MPTDPQSAIELGSLLTDVQAALVEEAQRRVHAAGYTDVRASHDCVFRFLEPEGGTRLRALADRSGMTPQSIGEHVDELERLGYVERVADPSDRRAKLIRLTPRGRAFMAVGGNALADVIDEWGEAIGERSLAQLRKLLAQIRAVQLTGADGDRRRATAAQSR
jgi:DNA-binding MarR family transcriptional regulator